MKTFSFEELSEAAQQNAKNLYYADSDYQQFFSDVQAVNADECPDVQDWAREKDLKFNEEGERLNVYYIIDMRFPHIPRVQVFAKSETLAKIAYCKEKGLNPLLSSEKLNIWTIEYVDPDNVAF